MNLDQITAWRNRISRLAALFCAVFLISSLDGLVALFRQPANILLLLPGESERVNGPIRDSSLDLTNLLYVSSSPDIRLSFEGTQSGFWLGGSMWRGAVHVSNGAVPGEYTLDVREKSDPSQKPTSIFVVQVFPDQKARREAATSLILRLSGISPWWVFGGAFLLAAVAFGAVYLLSQKRDFLLAEAGMAEIYRIARVDGGYEIAFGLGKKNGIAAGDQLPLFDIAGNEVGVAFVESVYESDATARVGSDCKVKPGYFVSRKS